MTREAGARRGPGRPRSERVRQAVLRAPAELVDAEGYGRLTMDAIARRAGVSRQTLYRWWSTPAEIILEALNEAAARAAPLPDTGALDTDLRLFVRRTVSAVSQNSRLLAALMAEAQLNADFGTSFRNQFLARRRGFLRELLGRGRDRGEISNGADLDFLTEFVFAMIWYRVLTEHAPLNRRFADQLSGTVLELAAR